MEAICKHKSRSYYCWAGHCPVSAYPFLLWVEAGRDLFTPEGSLILERAPIMPSFLPTVISAEALIPPVIQSLEKSVPAPLVSPVLLHFILRVRVEGFPASLAQYKVVVEGIYALVLRTGKMAQHLRALTDLPEDSRSTPSNHVTAHNCL